MDRTQHWISIWDSLIRNIGAQFSLHKEFERAGLRGSAELHKQWEIEAHQALKAFWAELPQEVRQDFINHLEQRSALGENPKAA